jgi:hypothetical protein
MAFKMSLAGKKEEKGMFLEIAVFFLAVIFSKKYFLHKKDNNHNAFQ